MMHVPLKLREPKSLVTPKGPSFTWASTVRTQIAGTGIEFKLPKHSPRHANNEQTRPERDYAYERLRFSSKFSDEDATLGRKNHFEEMLLLWRSWAFNGPWLTGTLAELSLSVRLVKPINYDQKFSLFHPRAMEMIISDYLTFLYGHRLDKFRNNIQEYIAPVDWLPLNNLSVNTASMRAVSQDFTPHRRNSRMVFFPIVEDIMMLFSFDPSRLKNLPVVELDKLVDPKPMHDMIDKIINSIQLKLSPEAQAQQAKALEGLADTSLIKNFPPIKWDNLDEKITQAVLLEARPNNSSQ